MSSVEPRCGSVWYLIGRVLGFLLGARSGLGLLDGGGFDGGGDGRGSSSGGSGVSIGLLSASGGHFCSCRVRWVGEWE